MQISYWNLLAPAALLALVCCKSESTPSDPPPTPKKSAASQPSEVKVLPKNEPIADTPTYREATCDFVGFEGEGDERTATFKIQPIGKKPIKRAQTWIYYYDESGKELNRYPSALFGEVTTKARKLGSKGKGLKAGTTNAACEITEITFADESTWSNYNLLAPSFKKQPIEGYTDSQLAESAKVHLVVEHADTAPTGKIMAKIENLSGRPLIVKLINTFYYDENKKLLKWFPTNLHLALKSGATVEQEIGFETEKIPEGTRYVQSEAPKAKFTDGDKEDWENQNIGHYKRKMVE